MLQDRGELTLSHLQPDAGLIKNSADVMHNERVNTKIKQLPPHLLRGTWHLTYMEHRYARQNLYQLKCRCGLLPCRMQGPFHLQEGEGFCATAEEVHATRTKEEEMVQELLSGWQKGAHGYIPEVKEDNVI
jgi:hypothetical protein